MEKYIFMLVGIVLGIAISLYIYGEKKERYAKRVKNDQEYYSTKKLDQALEKAVTEMQLKMKELNRKLTEDEKNDIIFGYLNRAQNGETLDLK